ncbi:hypothetical protein WOLCODRAFT_131722 [Wolfiporia cocos MD-104 SS10]|uniref:Cyclin N-terminal domain-containing protein n=1 Tax=Wolfiporia cocos (strain MD-104) TaxID=742152 RepID=A0A2H3JTI1_WOLCO|nr:hypothetical protein WOLCODRAFT_131722 [Wolfiporia cocos MD-104 SS10]
MAFSWPRVMESSPWEPPPPLSCCWAAMYDWNWGKTMVVAEVAVRRGSREALPVPLYSKQPAHQVIKINQSGETDHQPSVFQHLTQSLPVPPRGPPPSLGTREEWISSLPSWRRNKPRRIWEEDSSDFCGHYRRPGFEEGLAVADNAAVIKGAHAQACIPPVSTLLASAGFASPSPPANMYAGRAANVDDDMNVYARAHGWHGAERRYSSDVSPLASAAYEEMDHEDAPDVAMGYEGYATDTPESCHGGDSGRLYAAQTYERGAFTPVFEDISPGPFAGRDPGSSPIGPATPFAEFVDRAVAATAPSYEQRRAAEAAREPRYAYQDQGCGAQCYQCQTYGHVEQAMPAPAPEPVVTPTATAAYKKLAEPISEWIANYVWKVCTTGMDLSPAYAQPHAFVKHYSTSPPSHLASSTHSMLLSTLLQPSAIFLALRYITRLPVFFGPVNLDRELHRKEIRFRTELLGEAHLYFDRDAVESYAPFRLVLLGCMLANKWLDDHTFSNKTWHTISNVPIQSLNKLESLALDIFQYDLSISTHEWAEWLSQLTAYHSSLTSPSYPQPISRPSSSPHVIIRKALDMLIEVRVAPQSTRYDGDGYHAGPPQPVFVGIEDRKKQEAGGAYEDAVDMLEIDLDEDGPLREEYLPRRRTGSLRRSQVCDKPSGADRMLPPPAKWSPEADSPIIRHDSRHYVAPRPITHIPIAAPPPVPMPYHQVLETHHSSWPYAAYAPKPEVVGHDHYGAPLYRAQPVYSGYEYAYPVHQGHSRSHSQSLSYNPALVEQPQGHLRSYSQTCFDPGYSDVRYDSHYMPPPPPPLNVPSWASAERTAYPAEFYDRSSFEYHPRPLKV